MIQSDNIRSRMITHSGILISFFIIFTVIFSPVIQNNYLFMDDYAFVKTHANQEKSLYQEIIDRSRDGKVIYGFFLHEISNNIKYDNLIRLIGILSLSLFSFVIYIYLGIYQINKTHAFLVSVLVCTLPSFQLFVAWMVAFPYIYSAILSFICGLILFKVLSGKNTGSLRYQVSSFLIVIVLMVIALHIYQPTAMLYWASGVIPLLLLKEEDFKRRWRLPFILYIMTGFISLAAYFFTVKILHHIFSVGFPGRGGLIKLEMIPLKLKWFFYCPLNYALNLWNIFPTYKLAAIVGIVITGTVLSIIFQVLNNNNKSSLLWNNCQRLFLITCLLLLSFLPNLLITDNLPPYRTLVSLETTICFLLYFGFVNLLNLFRFIPGFPVDLKDKAINMFLLILVVITTYHAHKNVNDFAMLQANELKYVKNAVSGYGISKLSNISEIYVRRPDEKKIMEAGFLYDEFGKPTTSVIWGPPNVVNVALYELGIKADVTSNIKITQGASCEPIPKGENILAIDMTKFDYLSNIHSSITKPQRYCITFPSRL